MSQEEGKTLATWQANLALRDGQCRVALKLVLEFKANAHADKKRLVKDSWARLTNPCFPREVLILVIEATVRSQAPYLSLCVRPLRRFVDLIFARWPESMSRQTRGLLRQIAARALLTHSIIGIIGIVGDFTKEYALEFPPVLRSREQFLRYLALEVGGWPSEGAYLWNLARSPQAIKKMRLQLPNLETCVILYTFIHDDGAYFHYRPLITGGKPGSVERILTMRIFKSRDCADTLESWILQSIAAFREDGPGKRRFVQFSHFDDDKERLSAGPLVRVDDDLLQSTAPAAGHTSNPSTTRRVFERAYWHNPNFRGSSWATPTLRLLIRTLAACSVMGIVRVLAVRFSDMLILQRSDIDDAGMCDGRESGKCRRIHERVSS